MKSKKISKKLVLNKSTIVHLNVNELNKVLGGSVTSDTTIIECNTVRTMCAVSACPKRYPYSYDEEWC
ncbi:MAG TPA: class I lanthipeptide [Candidatus Deferrimicrobium sp.]|nr:class I lanthipeptide [Candidatus Deferrimicrobium sp.]